MGSGSSKDSEKAPPASAVSSTSSNTELDTVMYSYTAEVNVLEDENRMLRETVKNLRDELEKYKSPPHLICEVKDLIDGKAILSLKNGNEFLVNIAADVTDLRPGDMVVAHQKNLVVIGKVDVSKWFNVEQFVIMEKPTVSWGDVGGLQDSIREVQEVIELPLKQPELFKEIGITPPKGVLLYGPPGTGKTLIAKAVAAATKATFIEVVGSELVQKFIGEGAKLVHEIFELAKAKAPAIIFIDELDSLASQRIDVGTSGEREVQRTFMQLLAEIDGFSPLGDVKIIGAPNRKDILDPAVIRPGRLDRLIHIEPPGAEGLLEIFNIHTKKMKLGRLDKKKIVSLMEGMTGAEVRAVCTEAGYFAIRASKKQIVQKDFVEAIAKVRAEEESEGDDYMKMFG